MSVAPRQVDAPGARLTPGAPARRRRVHSDLAIALGIVAFCGVVYAITMTFPEVPAAFASGMGPEVFPRLLLGVLVVLAGVMVLLARGKEDTVREPIPAMVYWTALAMLAFMGLVWLAGMIPAMFLGFVGLGLLWGERRWPILVIAGFALTALIYAMFVKGFAIPLPRGLLGEWLLG
jgi:putative tricarboxylic transport membrane protein